MHIGCRALTASRYCAAHERLHPKPLEAAKRAFDEQRQSAAARGYGHRWRKLRLIILRRDPICKIGEKCAGLALSTDVDHIIPKEAGGTDEESNLQGACHACHSWKTATQDSRFTQAAREMPKRVGGVKFLGASPSGPTGQLQTHTREIKSSAISAIKQEFGN